MSLAGAVRRAVREVDADQPIADVQTMQTVLAGTLGKRRLTMWLLGSFAGVAWLLSVVGIYGTVAYSVVQRTQEVGIRRALGARESDILRMVLREGLVLAAVGGVFGMGGAWILTRWLRSWLFEVSATDPGTFAGVLAAFVGVSLLASYMPARRAVGVDPMRALRME